MRTRSPSRSLLAWSCGITLAVGSLIGIVVAPATSADAASNVYLATCTSYFTAGASSTNDADITITDTSTTPGIADLTVAFPGGTTAESTRLHDYTGTTRWISADAQIVWNGVTSPAASFVWDVYPVTGAIEFSTGPFAAPTSAQPTPGLLTFHFQGDATIPPSPGPGYDTGLTVCQPRSDLAVSISHTGDFAAGQAGARSEIVVSNPSPYVSVGTTITAAATLPAELAQAVAEGGAVSMGGPGWTCDSATLRCTRFDLVQPGGSYPPIALLVDVPPGLTTPVTTTATLSQGAGDTNAANNTASDTADVAGYASSYTSKELRLVDAVGAFIGDPDRADVQRTGALFLAYLDGIIAGQGLTPPTFGSDWPWRAGQSASVTTVYSPADEAVVTATASRFSTDVPTLQRRGVLLVAYLIALPPR